jgi:hypothetical protein
MAKQNNTASADSPNACADKNPDPDAERLEFREWAMESDDAVAFRYRILHEAHANDIANRRGAFAYTNGAIIVSTANACYR